MENEQKVIFYISDSEINTESPTVVITANSILMSDYAFELKKNLYRWKLAHERGHKILKNIKRLNTCEPLPKEFFELCTNMKEVYDKMDSIVENLKEIKTKIREIAELEKDKGPLFHTWPTEIFVAIAEKAHEFHRKEANVKRAIHDNVVQGHTIQAKIDNLVKWEYDTQIPKNIDRWVESMLEEVKGL